MLHFFFTLDSAVGGVQDGFIVTVKHHVKSNPHLEVSLGVRQLLNAVVFLKKKELLPKSK